MWKTTECIDRSWSSRSWNSIFTPPLSCIQSFHLTKYSYWGECFPSFKCLTNDDFGSPCHCYLLRSTLYLTSQRAIFSLVTEQAIHYNQSILALTLHKKPRTRRTTQRPESSALHTQSTIHIDSSRRRLHRVSVPHSPIYKPQNTFSSP